MNVFVVGRVSIVSVSVSDQATSVVKFGLLWLLFEYADKRGPLRWVGGEGGHRRVNREKHLRRRIVLDMLCQVASYGRPQLALVLVPSTVQTFLRCNLFRYRGS